MTSLSWYRRCHTSLWKRGVRGGNRWDSSTRGDGRTETPGHKDRETKRVVSHRTSSSRNHILKKKGGSVLLNSWVLIKFAQCFLCFRHGSTLLIYNHKLRSVSRVKFCIWSSTVRGRSLGGHQRVWERWFGFRPTVGGSVTDWVGTGDETGGERH